MQPDNWPGNSLKDGSKMEDKNVQIIEVVYSPLCEATGAMIGKLRKGGKLLY